MNSNLFKRIGTSIILLIILSVSLLTNKYLWLILLMIASIISFHEFNNLIKKAYKNKKRIINFLFIVNILFLTSLVFIGYNIYTFPPTGIIFIILICIFSDTGGYVIGKLIGGKKLTKISPKKTISGSFGSFAFSLLPLIIYLSIYEVTGNVDFYPNNITNSIYVSLFLSFVCQLGDLFISFFKRKAKVKNTGSILPGHGGLLDRIDGLIFVLPVAFIVDKIFF